MVVTGAAGMLGTDVVAVAREHGWAVQAWGRAQLDIHDGDAVARALDGAQVVINCAAYTDVDKAEDDAETAFAVNAHGAGTVARACAEVGARLVHLSTDYVFDGTATEPYSADAPVSPVSVYGKSKAAGEQAVRDAGGDALIVRTAWLYGAHGHCFPRTIARLAGERERLSVVNDQTGQPTWTRDVADLIMRLLAAHAHRGIYHATSQGYATWWDFAHAVVQSIGASTPVDPVTSAEFVRPAPRPSWSVLSHDSLTDASVAPIGPWEQRWAAAAGDVLGA